MSEPTPTAEQQQAIDYPHSMVAIAKPGSGKTFVLANKIRSQLDAAPSYKGVIAISFTNKASDELRKRSSKGGIDLKSSFFGTIDRFCFSEIIIPFLPHLWGKPTAEIDISRIRDLEEAEQAGFETIEGEITPELPDGLIPQLKQHFSKGKLFLDVAGPLALYTILKSTACQRYLQTRYTHVIIDEYQDSGSAQHELFIKLHNLGLVAVAVGDADQSIYGFSNKDSKHLLALAKESEFKTFPITFNHRCHFSIINYSLRLLDSKSALLKTDDIHVYYKSCQGNVNAVAKWIDAVLPGLMQIFEIKQRNHVGILVRNNLTGSLMNSHLSVEHRLIHPHPLEENVSLWGAVFCELLRFRFDEANTVQEIIDRHDFRLTTQETAQARKIIKNIRSCEDKDLFAHMESAAKLFVPNANKDAPLALLRGSTIDELKRSFAPAKADEVQIMTIHKSKGLEFDLVFHLDLHEWVLPSKTPGPNNDFNNPIYPTLIQDRNLHYVGITRARKACIFCTSTRRTNSQQQDKAGKPSEFLFENGLEALRVDFPFDVLGTSEKEP
jgi:superfamily I DNA/RNA helicase